MTPDNFSVEAENLHVLFASAIEDCFKPREIVGGRAVDPLNSSSHDCGRMNEVRGDASA
jgi:hypothetical protein